MQRHLSNAAAQRQSVMQAPSLPGARWGLIVGGALVLVACAYLILAPDFYVSWWDEDDAGGTDWSGAPTPCVDTRLTAMLPPAAELNATLSQYVETLLRQDRSQRAALPPMFRCEPLGLIGGHEAPASDGGKYICGLPQLTAPCVVYSLGSNLDFSFEAAVSRATPCRIVTVDCTVEEKRARRMLPPRTRFFPLCLGAADNAELKQVGPWGGWGCYRAFQLTPLPPRRVRPQ